MIGMSIDYKRNYKAVVGTYTEAGIDDGITNDNVERQQSCIYLRPPGNYQGSVKCFVIDAGTVVSRKMFDASPYPDALLKK